MTGPVEHDMLVQPKIYTTDVRSDECPDWVLITFMSMQARILQAAFHPVVRHSSRQCRSQRACCLSSAGNVKNSEHEIILTSEACVGQQHKQPATRADPTLARTPISSPQS
jgi:hypothetical protein